MYFWAACPPSQCLSLCPPHAVLSFLRDCVPSSRNAWTKSPGAVTKAVASSRQTYADFSRGTPFGLNTSVPTGASLQWAARPLVLVVALFTLAIVLTAAMLASKPASLKLRPVETNKRAGDFAALAASELTRVNRYVDDMRRVAELTLRELVYPMNLSEARENLERHRPKPGENDIRSFEWGCLNRHLQGERMTLSGHRGEVFHVDYSADGTLLASAGQDGVRIWEAATGSSLLTLEHHSDDVNWVTFSPDGASVATASDDKTVGVWSTTDGRARPATSCSQREGRRRGFYA